MRERVTRLIPRTLLKAAMLPIAALVAIGASSATATVASAVTAAPSSTYVAQGPISTDWLFDVSCPGGQTTRCWTAGDLRDVNGNATSGVIWHDSTGGGSGPWVKDLGVPATPDGLHGISCPTATRCWAVGGNNTILYNGNAAFSDVWTPQASTIPGSHFLYHVSCGDGNHCVAVGDSGVTTYTVNGGTTWNYVQVGTDHLYGVSCFSATNCVAVGDLGVAYRTTTSGASWSAESTGTTRPLNGVFCSAYCYAVGDSPGGGAPAVILYSRTPNKWVPASSNASRATLWAVACAATARCSAAGNDGQIIDTSGSSGTNWFDNSPTTGIELHGVSCFPGPKTCVVVGELGSVYKGTP